MPTIGLTGNFGMGKSTVLKMFGSMGAATVDVDELVDAVLKKRSVLKRIAKILGKGILVGKAGNLTINRKRTADLIFSNTAKRKSLEQIIHPEVLKLMLKINTERLSRHPGSVIVCEVPLLFEAGYQDYFDKTALVYTRRDTALRRLLKKGFSKDEALKRLKAQMPITKKKKMADYFIDNNRDLKVTEKKVARILNKIAG